MERTTITQDAPQALRKPEATAERLLDALPGARERAELGMRQARAGETVSLDTL